MNHLERTNINIDDNTSNFFDPRPLEATDLSKDTLHYGHAMKAHDRDDFIAAMEKEVNNLTNTKVWKLILKYDMPRGAKSHQTHLEFQAETKPTWRTA